MLPRLPVQDKRHAAATPHRPTSASPVPSPRDVDRSETGVRRKAPLLPPRQEIRRPHDYQWQLGEADGAGNRRMWVTIGFGSNSRTFHSEAAKFEPGVWRHVAFTYDGAGEGRFFVDGESAGRHFHPESAGPFPEPRPSPSATGSGATTAAFRVTSTKCVFVRVSSPSNPSRSRSTPRGGFGSAWSRPPRSASPARTCGASRSPERPSPSLVRRWQDRNDSPARPRPRRGTRRELRRRHRPPSRRLSLFRARLDLTNQKPSRPRAKPASTLVARHPVRMPVIMWGAGGEEIPRLKELGFTHFIGMSALAGAIWQEKKAVPPETPPTSPATAVISTRPSPTGSRSSPGSRR